MYPICSSPGGAQQAPQPQPPSPKRPRPGPPAEPQSLHPSLPRARLSSFDIDRQLEARLRSLSPPAPVSVYLAVPRADELQQRFERLQAAAAGTQSWHGDEAELERRLKRLQGEDVPAAAAERGQQPAALLPSSAARLPPSLQPSEGDELGELLRQVQDEVQLDYQAVYDTAVQLGRPLDGSDKSHSGTGSERKGDGGAMEGKEAEVGGVDVDDAERLMNELQRLPSTEIVKLKHVAGSHYRSDGEYEEDDDDES